MATAQLLKDATSWSVLTYTVAALTAWYLAASLWAALYNLYLSPVARFPGSKLRAAFDFPEAFSILSGNAYQNTRQLHEKYGKVVRISPFTLFFTTAEAWKGTANQKPILLSNNKSVLTRYNADIYGFKQDRTEFAKQPGFYEPDSDILGKDHLVQIADKPLIHKSTGADQKDHTRMRKLFAHAFTDAALLEQASLLTRYFDLLVSNLKRKIDGPTRGRVDLMTYYSCTTLDIIGDLMLGKSFGALENDEMPFFIRNIMESAKYLGILKFSALYPVVQLALKLLEVAKPSIKAKRVDYMEFTKSSIEKRMEMTTDRKDFMTYA
ncbi:MAG: hypothetical protein Q9169_007909, partial [Polycauliona sp. 2 TL-2023]